MEVPALAFGTGVPISKAMEDKTRMNAADARLERQFHRIGRQVPASKGFLDWVRRPHLHIVRIPLSISLILGGVFSFLPVLGIWMLPLGLLVLAVDIPPPAGRWAMLSCGCSDSSPTRAGASGSDLAAGAGVGRRLGAAEERVSRLSRLSVGQPTPSPVGAKTGRILICSSAVWP